MNTISSMIGLVFAGLLVIVLLGGLLAFPVMWLWNGCLVPAIPGIQEVTWLQSWGLMILCNILFKTSVSSK